MGIPTPFQLQMLFSSEKKCIWPSGRDYPTIRIGKNINHSDSRRGSRDSRKLLPNTRYSFTKTPGTVPLCAIRSVDSSHSCQEKIRTKQHEYCHDFMTGYVSVINSYPSVVICIRINWSADFIPSHKFSATNGFINTHAY